MSKDKKEAQAPTTSEKCGAEGCKSGIQRMHFCNEHFAWYKEGLINKKGVRPTDFDKKHQHYMLRKTG